MKKRFLIGWAGLLLCALLALPVLADTDVYVFDPADYLSDAEESRLNETLRSYSDQTQADLVIAVLDTEWDQDLGDETFFFYRQQGLGRGYARSGVLLVVDMGKREYFVYSEGTPDYHLTDTMREAIYDAFDDGFSSGGLYSACRSYADRVLTLLLGEPYDEPENKPSLTMLVLGSLGGGFLISWISVTSMKKKLISVSEARHASRWMVSGSLRLQKQNELYLYHNLTRIAKSQNNGSRSGGHSSGTRSFSGGGHGGGRHF